MLNVSVRQLGIFEPAYFWDKAPEGIAGNDEWCGVEGFDSKLHDAVISIVLLKHPWIGVGLAL